MSEEFSAKMEFIDHRRMKRIKVRLQDADNEDIDVKEAVESINEFIKDKLKEETGNTTIDEIFPMMTQLLVAGIYRATGDAQTSQFILSNGSIRYAVLQQMMLSHYFLKFVQKNNLKILTDEEDIDQEELDRLMRIDKANSIASMGSIMGISPKELVAEMVKQNKISKEDMASMGYEVPDSSEDEDPDGSSN